MKLSIVVIFHNMQREARRTLHSLSPAYQTGVDASEYEVIAIDNGSALPLSEQEVRGHGPNFRYRFFETGAVSPVAAANAGVAMATGAHVAVIVDGARMATPGLVWSTLKALHLVPDPLVYALSWHLGPDIQGNSMQTGYDQAEEDRLLASIGWPEDGYRLFEISTIAPSSIGGFLGDAPAEFSWFAMPRAAFLAIGGFEARFCSPGGGLVNQDFRDRVLSMRKTPSTVLLGEGVFHQFHGGVATNIRTQDLKATLKSFHQEYRAIRGRDCVLEAPPAVFYFGRLPRQARRFLGKASA